jgi:hypothetical protein
MRISQQDGNVAWLRYPGADAYVSGLLEDYLAGMPPARRLAADVLARTGSRLVDWLDHLVLADGEQSRRDLSDAGFESQDVPSSPSDAAYHHPGALFPGILLRTGTGAAPGHVVAAAIKVEDVSRFLMTHKIAAAIEGTPLSPYRRARVGYSDGRELLVVERRGHEGFVPKEMPPDYPRRYLDAAERWATRPREFDDDRLGMERTLDLARSLVGEMGRDTAAWIAFAVERAFWQHRNRAGQVQKARQDSLGLGWANHDHHTFRSSRTVFSLLIEILETFGFQARERFYAGAEAGWGAQVMEQPVCRFAVFADADLSPGEVEGDFGHSPLPRRDELGTVGLWCALHGESMLGAGLHHLAGRFDFDAVRSDLSEWGIGMMRPFSEFPYLRQAFSTGERWPVSADRLVRLAEAGLISGEQRALFADRGAIGSHLENIQRGEGFKGFNQQTISDIILRTDPRATPSTT